VIDTLPLWFWMPAAIILWAIVLHPYVRRFRPVSALVARGFAEWRECRAEFDLALDAAYEAAADATNDRLVNAAGRRAGIDPRSLFYGPERRAQRYASPELLEWWESRPRLTFEAFERQWMASA
jgi:hypothetical protein